jgi:Calcineurin-like phosphoesterase
MHSIYRTGVIALCTLAIAAVSACGPRLQIKDIEPQEIETTLFLIGDAGEPDPRHPALALDSLRRQAAEAPGRSIIVFLGDNVYPNGIPLDSTLTWPDARRRLESQINAVPPGVRGIFLPGNHDWDGTGPYGLYSVRLQERMIASLAGGRDVRMLPGNGCPGPVAFDAGRLRFIALDTQWWLQQYIVRDADSKCNTTVNGVTTALRNMIQTKPEGRVVIVGGHHPLMTGGEHGGYCGITGPFRRLSGSAQDVLSSLNRTMRDSLESAFGANPPLAYAAGHDHNLQVLKGAPDVQYLLVSGAGSVAKAACAVYMRESYYVSQHRVGFMRVDILRTKGVLLSVFDYSSNGVPGKPFSRWLETR